MVSFIIDSATPKSGTTIVHGSAIATMPVGFRPLVPVYVNAISYVNNSWINFPVVVNPNGYIYFYNINSGSSLTLSYGKISGTYICKD